MVTSERICIEKIHWVYSLISNAVPPWAPNYCIGAEGHPCTSHKRLLWSLFCMYIYISLLISLYKSCMCLGPSNHSKLSLIIPVYWWSLEMNEVSVEKQPDESFFLLLMQTEQQIPNGRRREYNMCIRPHNIIHNGHTCFHTNGFHCRGSPLALTETGVLQLQQI